MHNKIIVLQLLWRLTLIINFINRLSWFLKSASEQRLEFIPMTAAQTRWPLRKRSQSARVCLCVGDFDNARTYFDVIKLLGRMDVSCLVDIQMRITHHTKHTAHATRALSNEHQFVCVGATARAPVDFDAPFVCHDHNFILFISLSLFDGLSLSC